MSVQWLLISLFVALQALDVLSTWTALRLGMIEANPFAAVLLDVGGEPLAYWFKAGCTVAVVSAVALLSSRFPRLIAGLWVGTAFMALVVASNLFNLLAV